MCSCETFIKVFGCCKFCCLSFACKYRYYPFATDTILVTWRCCMALFYFGSMLCCTICLDESHSTTPSLIPTASNQSTQTTSTGATPTTQSCKSWRHAYCHPIWVVALSISFPYCAFCYLFGLISHAFCSLLFVLKSSVNFALFVPCQNRNTYHCVSWMLH